MSFPQWSSHSCARRNGLFSPPRPSHRLPAIFSADAAPAVIDNVFYLTTPENAAALMAETERKLFGVTPKKR